MAQAESKLSRKIMKELRLQGYFCFKVHGSEYMTEGLPDIMVCAEGHFVALEVKMPLKRKNTSVKQDLIIERINDAGGTAAVVCSAAEALTIIAKVINKGANN